MKEYFVAGNEEILLFITIWTELEGSYSAKQGRWWKVGSRKIPLSVEHKETKPEIRQCPTKAFAMIVTAELRLARDKGSGLKGRGHLWIVVNGC